jgi:hypothetical protein
MSPHGETTFGSLGSLKGTIPFYSSYELKIRGPISELKNGGSVTKLNPFHAMFCHLSSALSCWSK